MSTAIGLACVCAGIACLLGVSLVGRIHHWWAEWQADPKRHAGDFWLWSKEDPREVDHE